MKLKSRLLSLSLLFAVLSAALGAALPSTAAGYKSLTPAGIADGPGIWINIWHYPEGDLDAYSSRMRAHGVRNLFVQTSRSNTEAVKDPAGLGALIEAAHRHNIRVIAWSFAELLNPTADADKMIAAAHFQSPKGERIDGIAPNLEQNLDKWRVETYSQHLRQVLGRTYPMMAVVFSPLNRAPQVAKTPWKTLGEYYDVIAPMAYWGGKHQRLDAYTYTRTTVEKVRALTGRSNIEVHVIGDGMGTSAESLDHFLRACKDSEATSASLYPNHRPTAEQLVAMSRYSNHFPTNSRFRLAAFRELTRSGALAEPPGLDPSQKLNRGQFYLLVVQQLFPGIAVSRQSDDGLTHAGVRLPEEALSTLIGSGLVAELPAGVAPAQALSGTISTRDALTIIAGVVDLKSRERPRGKTSAKHRADRWFAPPAVAEPATAREPASSGVNYLDAAQMILEARAGLR